MLFILTVGIFIIISCCDALVSLKGLRAWKRDYTVSSFDKSSSETAIFERIIQLCPTVQFITNKSDCEIFKLVHDLEHSLPSPVDMSNITNQQALTGLWKTLATDLPLQSHPIPFSKLYFLKPNLCSKDVMVTITDVFQFVNSSSSSSSSENNYDNYLTFSIENEKGRSFDASIWTRGNFLFPTSSPLNRLAVQFFKNEMSRPPLSKDNTHIDEIRSVLCVNDGVPLEMDLALKCWSDVVYLSEDGRFRIMRGNAGNTYVLQKL